MHEVLVDKEHVEQEEGHALSATHLPNNKRVSCLKSNKFVQVEEYVEENACKASLALEIPQRKDTL
jgi:hypothetical protein